MLFLQRCKKYRQRKMVSSSSCQSASEMNLMGVPRRTITMAAPGCASSSAAAVGSSLGLYQRRFRKTAAKVMPPPINLARVATKLSAASSSNGPLQSSSGGGGVAASTSPSGRADVTLARNAEDITRVIIQLIPKEFRQLVSPSASSYGAVSSSMQKLPSLIKQSEGDDRAEQVKKNAFVTFQQLEENEDARRMLLGRRVDTMGSLADKHSPARAKVESLIKSTGLFSFDKTHDAVKVRAGVRDIAHKTFQYLSSTSAGGSSNNKIQSIGSVASTLLTSMERNFVRTEVSSRFERILLVYPDTFEIMRNGQGVRLAPAALSLVNGGTPPTILSSALSSSSNTNTPSCMTSSSSSPSVVRIGSVTITDEMREKMAREREREFFAGIENVIPRDGHFIDVDAVWQRYVQAYPNSAAAQRAYYMRPSGGSSSSSSSSLEGKDHKQMGVKLLAAFGASSATNMLSTPLCTFVRIPPALLPPLVTSPNDDKKKKNMMNSRSPLPSSSLLKRMVNDASDGSVSHRRVVIPTSRDASSSSSSPDVMAALCLCDIKMEQRQTMNGDHSSLHCDTTGEEEDLGTFFEIPSCTTGGEQFQQHQLSKESSSSYLDRLTQSEYPIGFSPSFHIARIVAGRLPYNEWVSAEKAIVRSETAIPDPYRVIVRESLAVLMFPYGASRRHHQQLSLGGGKSATLLPDSSVTSIKGGLHHQQELDNEEVATGLLDDGSSEEWKRKHSIVEVRTVLLPASTGGSSFELRSRLRPSIPVYILMPILLSVKIESDTTLETLGDSNVALSVVVEKLSPMSRAWIRDVIGASVAGSCAPLGEVLADHYSHLVCVDEEMTLSQVSLTLAGEEQVNAWLRCLETVKVDTDYSNKGCVRLHRDDCFQSVQHYSDAISGDSTSMNTSSSSSSSVTFQPPLLSAHPSLWMNPVEASNPTGL